MADPGPRQVFARRLRALREEHWPGRKVNQDQLAAALSRDREVRQRTAGLFMGVSGPNPQVPPTSRIQDIATFFATPRSFDGKVGRLLRPSELSAPEQAAREELLQELTRLRSEALAAPDRSSDPTTISDGTRAVAHPFSGGLYRFKAGDRITIVCGQVPDAKLKKMPYTDPLDPDFIASYRYSDPDALIELWGHLRAADPGSPVDSGPRTSCQRMTTRVILSRSGAWTGTRQQAQSSCVFSFRWFRSTIGTRRGEPTSR